VGGSKAVSTPTSDEPPCEKSNPNSNQSLVIMRAQFLGARFFERQTQLLHRTREACFVLVKRERERAFVDY
jgi:hypothetical protein